MRDFVDTPGMPGTFEFSGEPDFDHSHGKWLAEKIARETHDVSVIVSATEFGSDVIVASSGSNTTEFIGDDAHAHACATDEDATIDLCTRDGFCHAGTVVGVIDALVILRSKIESLMSEIGHQCEDFGFDLHAAMIAGNGYLHHDGWDLNDKRS